jgi:hypothetical protein
VVLIIFCGFLSFPSPSYAGTISPSLIPARTSGVAPLAVFFDASATTGSVTSNPFSDLDYTWSFGDPSSGNWQPTDGSATGKSRNQAKGPVAAHVFETPGTYTVTMTVFDGTNTAQRTQAITVTDPNTVFSGTNTYCFSSSGTFTGCPSGANQITTPDFAAAINTYKGTGRRLLFRRGETFNAASDGIIAVTGPGIVGAFGTGNVPKIIASMSDSAVLHFSSSTTPSITDWRVMDMEFDGQASTGSGAIGADGGIDQLTFLRLTAHHFSTAFGAGTGLLNAWLAQGHTGHHVWDQFTIADSNIYSAVGAGCYGAYLAGTRFAWMGNTINDTTCNNAGSHNLRVTYADKAVFSDSIFMYPFPTRHALKLHGPCWGNNGAADVCYYEPVLGYTYTQNVLISGNQFRGATGDTWTVALSPQNGNSDERLRKIIVDGNWFRGGDGTQNPLETSVSDLTVRNNIFNATGTGGYGGVTVARRGYEPYPTDVRIYNNSIYSSATNEFSAVTVDAGSVNVTVRNNVAYAPNASSAVFLTDNGATNTVQSNNSTNSQIKNTAPGWTNISPSIVSDFMLTAGSYALNAGIAIQSVFRDIAGILRGATPDMGAFEYTSGGGGDTTPPAAPSGLSVF